ncbi:hypothetical protein DFH08DRAFT_966597 [Mycena albidolilacea]|uniref:Uncharacterized protein n=1 Tax=Mycena albidolilacea TaxID=1033008 RepID=A0AAD7EKT6_9AGAR|nr:hypothetical protein DFH08DRAFT_966597 [Mycena albidolilacea]
MPNLRWLSVFCLTGALLLPLALATFEQIAADIGVISVDFIKVDNDFQVPSLNSSQTQVILNDASVIPRALAQATSDVQITGRLDDTDGSALFTLWKNVESTINDVTNQFSNHVIDFLRLGLAALCLELLSLIENGLHAFLAAFTAELPKTITVSSNGSPVTVDDVTLPLATVIAAYEAATSSTDSIRSFEALTPHSHCHIGGCAHPAFPFPLDDHFAQLDDPAAHNSPVSRYPNFGLTFAHLERGLSARSCTPRRLPRTPHPATALARTRPHRTQTLSRRQPTTQISAEVSRTCPSPHQRHCGVAPSLSTCVNGLHAASLALTCNRVIADVPETAPRRHSRPARRTPLPPIHNIPTTPSTSLPHPIPHPRRIRASRHTSAAVVALPATTLRPRPFAAPISSLPASASLLRPFPCRNARPAPRPSALPRCHACHVPPPPHRRAVSTHPHPLHATYAVPCVVLTTQTLTPCAQLPRLHPARSPLLRPHNAQAPRSRFHSALSPSERRLPHVFLIRAASLPVSIRALSAELESVPAHPSSPHRNPASNPAHTLCHGFTHFAYTHRSQLFTHPHSRYVPVPVLYSLLTRYKIIEQPLPCTGVDKSLQQALRFWRV